MLLLRSPSEFAMPAGQCNLGRLAAHQHRRAARRALVLPQLINFPRLVLLGASEK
jgi:hypothetical protein